MPAIEKWKVLKSELVFNHKWYKLRKDEVQLPDGTVLDDYFVSVRPEVAVVFPVTAAKEVIFVRQYKHGIQEVVLELPGGVFDTTDKTAEEAARRELLEETGYTADKLVHLATVFDNPTKDTNRIHMFLAENAAKVAEQHLDPTENIRVETVPLAEVTNKILTGEICVSGSLAITFLALLALEKRVSE